MSVKVRINTIPSYIIKISPVAMSKKGKSSIKFRAMCIDNGREYDGKICEGDSVKVESEAVVCPHNWDDMNKIHETISKGLNG